MTRPVLSYYAMALVLALLAAGIGFKAGRYYPHTTGFVFHQEAKVSDWLRRPL